MTSMHQTHVTGKWHVFQFLPALLAGIVLITWLFFTPPGILSKFDAIGYSVCHQIAERSFFMFGRQMPLCSRCTGMYLGACASLVILLSGKRCAGLPDKKTLFVLLGFLVVFAADSINSFLQLLPSVPFLYPSQNWLRLVTGSGMGLSIPILLAPIFNATVWKNAIQEPIITRWRQLFLIFLVAGFLDATVLINNPYISTVLAVISALTVVAILTMVYTILWLMILKRDLQFTALRQLPSWLLIGFTTALVQIGIMDAIRFATTGTWAGFTL